MAQSRPAVVPVFPKPEVPELSMEAAVDTMIATFQRRVAEGAAKIREGLAMWDDAEEHTRRWLPEFPGQLKAQASQITVSVNAVVEGAEDAGKRMKGDALPPVQVIVGPKESGS